MIWGMKVIALTVPSYLEGVTDRILDSRFGQVLGLFALACFDGAAKSGEEESSEGSGCSSCLSVKCFLEENLVIDHFFYYA